MNKFVGYRCSICGEQYSPNDVTYTCPKDGGNLDVVLDYDSLKNKYKPDDILSRSDPSLWRFLPLLPVKEPRGEATPLHAAGGTPVFNLQHLAGKLGLQGLWVKDESRNPTASFKDRASAIVVARAKEQCILWPMLPVRNALHNCCPSHHFRHYNNPSSN